MGTTRERFLRINFFALLFALAANFLGMTYTHTHTHTHTHTRTHTHTHREQTKASSFYYFIGMII
jgi:hypothetical protein